MNSIAVHSSRASNSDHLLCHRPCLKPSGPVQKAGHTSVADPPEEGAEPSNCRDPSALLNGPGHEQKGVRYPEGDPDQDAVNSPDSGHSQISVLWSTNQVFQAGYDLAIRL